MQRDPASWNTNPFKRVDVLGSKLAGLKDQIAVVEAKIEELKKEIAADDKFAEDHFGGKIHKVLPILQSGSEDMAKRKAELEKLNAQKDNLTTQKNNVETEIKNEKPLQDH